ncbi:MAG: DEAD/DEAH box helicase [Methanobacteriota archaeon]|nr:MAG: DEAD/DEAH box helicase [Euryarchaeota archaeon]
MVSTFECPYCSGNLDHSKRKGIVTFFCEECGFSHKGKPGFSAEETFHLLQKKMRRTHASPATRHGFKTKRSLDEGWIKKGKKLRVDPKIEQNAIRAIQKLPQNIPEVVKKIASDRSYYLVNYDYLKPNPPKEGDPVEDVILFNGLHNVLKNKGISNLYEYQQQAYYAISSGHSVIITAPTGMGKTESFLLPIIERIVSENPNPFDRKGPQAIFIYPTKALAKDQLFKIIEYASTIGVSVKKFDGDTSKTERDSIYQNPPDILITNPDMIHYHLRSNFSFQGMVRNLKFLVIDEIHLCVGSYGSNVLWLIRRLKRFAPKMQLIGASATVSNAKGFAETMFEREVIHIGIKTARKSPMHLTMVYPKESSNLSTMARIISYLVRERKKTLAFANSHLTAEALNLILKNSSINSEVHRAGLEYSHRSSVEKAFRTGKLEALVSTPTLELGIDIGDLDAVVTMLTGLTNFIQRVGRAGRRGDESISALVFRGDDPISAYYARNPNEYLTEIDPVFVEPNNDLVGTMQILAMAFELPLTEAEADKYSAFAEPLLKRGILVKRNGRIRVKDKYKVSQLLQNFSIRGIGAAIDIYNGNKKVGQRSLPMALSELHPGAIYLHGGKTYEVIGFDGKKKVARIRETDKRGEKTQAERTMWPTVVEIDKEVDIDGLSAAYLTLELTETVTGYYRSNIFTDRIIGKYSLEKPLQYKFKTKGFAIQFPKPENVLEQTSEEKIQDVLGGTFHAIEHVLIESGNSLTGGGANQIGGLSMGDTGLVFVYDGSPGGSGLSKLLFERMEKGISRTLKILNDCPCGRIDGCPRCTYSYQCGNNNQPLHRIGAIDALQKFGTMSTELDFNFEGVETFIASPIHGDFRFSKS